MKSMSAAIGLAVLALAAPAVVTSAQAQGDRCNNYANQMISWDQRARQTRCTGWRGHSNFESHYNWCQARPPGAAQQALNGWGSQFQRCQFQASGSPAAQPPRPTATSGSPMSGMPRLGANCARLFREYNTSPGAKAFAASENGRQCGYAANRNRGNEASSVALGHCYGRRGVNCRVVHSSSF